MIIAKFKSTDSIVWGVPDSPLIGNSWFYCANCVDPDLTVLQAARLALGNKFCPNCGAKLTWPQSDENAEITNQEMVEKVKKHIKEAREWREALRNYGLRGYSLPEDEEER